MKAMRLERTAPAAERPLRLSDLDDPRPARGEVAIRVEACGVCRTDLHILEGEVTARLPVVPGHQAVGRVIETAPDVSGFEPGDRVGVGWMAWTCGACRFCLASRENLCETARFTGRDRDGGYAERMTADARWTYRLPEDALPAEAAPLLCAGIIGFRALRLSGIQPGGRLGLFGFGASAHLALQVARFWRCSAYAFTREESHRELALEMGADWAGDIDDDPGARLDAAVTFAPAGNVAVAALRRLDRGGVVAINAIHMSPLPAIDYADLYGERALRSVMNYTRRDAEEFLDLAARIPIRAETERFPLEDAGEALLRVARNRIRGAAVLEVAPTPVSARTRPRRA